MKHFPHYAQQESADCGPSCLRMIAKFYGKDYSAEMLRRHSYISRAGVSMLGISDAAEYIGFDANGLKMTFKQLIEEGIFPCILYWNHNHFVVCYGIDKCRGIRLYLMQEPVFKLIFYLKGKINEYFT